MARLNAFTGTPTAVALAAATAKSVLRLVAASNHRVAIKSFGVYFDGASTTAVPVLVRVLRQSTTGTWTSAVTAVPRDTSSETIQTLTYHTATVEPTAGNVLERFLCHPQQGYEKIYPLGDEIIIPGGGQVAIECTAPAIVNVVAYFNFEE